MATSKSVNATATARLKQDYLRLKRDPVPYVDAEPLASNILEWHYVVRGPEDSPYTGGMYHGKLVFPREFPFKPPSIYMITPNGRFKCNTRLCLSISDFHPDTWNPAWSVSTILTGLLSFMLETTPTLGSIQTSDSVKRQLAVASGLSNLSNNVFCELFPELVEEIKAANRKREEEEARRTKQRSNPGEGGVAAESKPSTWMDGGLFGNRAAAGAADANGMFHGVMSSVVLVVCIAAFAWSVKYVLTSLADQ